VALGIGEDLVSDHVGSYLNLVFLLHSGSGSANVACGYQLR
jgi:hypothetical protein